MTTENKGVLLIGAILIVVGLVTTAIKDVAAGSGKTLKTEVYKTEIGTLIEVVNVPGFGKCMLTSVDVICKE